MICTGKCRKDNWPLIIIIRNSYNNLSPLAPFHSQEMQVLPVHLLSVIVHLVNVPLLKLLQDVIYFALNLAIFSRDTGTKLFISLLFFKVHFVELYLHVFVHLATHLNIF